MSFKSKYCVNVSFSFAPVRLCRRTVEVGGVHLVAHGGDGLQQGDARLGQCVQNMVASVAWRIDAYLAAQLFNAELSFRRVELHPCHVGEVALELRILERLARYGVVIVVLPQAVLRTLHAVLPYAVGTFAHPLLRLHQLFGVVEADAHQIYHAVEVIVDAHMHAAVVQEPPRHLLQRAVLVVSHQRAVAEGESAERALVGIFRIFRLLLLRLFVVVVIETVLRAVGALGSDKPRSVAER